MTYFFETVGTIADGVGFSSFDPLHLFWLVAFVVLTAFNGIWYRSMTDVGKDRWRKVVAVLLIADELFKITLLCAVGEYSVWYLPLHLCSINIFIIAIYSWRPSKLLESFLYMVCIPGAIAALLFPTWTELPLLNFMHLHSFSVHILLGMYPLVLTIGGTFKPSFRDIPKCLLMLLTMAVLIYGINLLLDTNFMFLMYAEEGNPLYYFEQLWGSHLFGFPVLIFAVLVVMYLPLELVRKLRKNKTLV